MVQRRRRGVGLAGRRARHIGIIDIGSNSIRLVVFDGLSRIHHPLFNEKVLCGLGRGIERTGKLNAEGAVLALDNLARFAELSRAMGVRRLRVVGTSAVRDALDGPDFVAAVRKRAGLKIEVLDGGEEGRLSALGVLSGIPDADGLTGDLGGGSLELVRLAHGTIAENDTLPFGPLRLRELADKGRGKLRDVIDERLDALRWLNKADGKSFYAVGGAWRAIARLHMAHTDYPLHVIHHYAIRRQKAEEFLDLVSGLGRESLERLTDAPRKRLETLPLAATVLGRILRRIKPETLIFSAMGLREGCLFDELKPTLRRRDPLLAACEEVGAGNARFPVDGRTLLDWIDPILKRGNAARERLRLAACYLSDIAWSEHPDYRADIAFLRVLRMPLTGIDHPGRASLALSVFTRYDGAAEGEVTRPAWLLLSEDDLREAYLLGLGLRLAYTMSGGTDLLRRARLETDAKILRLVVAAGHRALIGEAVERRLDAIARALDRKALIKIG
jgi:exopolyphosphatase / guanosine-5'-triphosphate,3'-diphosphate pyrophosphatase